MYRRISQPEKPPVPFYLDHLNLDKKDEHLAKEEQLLRSEEYDFQANKIL